MADKKQQNPKGGKNQVKGSPKGKGGTAKKKAVKVPPIPEGYIPRLKLAYKERIVPEMLKQFNYKNVMLLPRLDKIVLNVGDGTLHSETKLKESIVAEMTNITGQAPVLTQARLSVANFKLRTGMVVGCRVTLRGWRMYEFLDRLVSIVIPRIRDFKGLSDKSFDGRGNYNFGVKEQIIFPEIDYDNVEKLHGMDVNICTSAETDEEALALLKGFGFPFIKRETEQDQAEVA